MFKLSLPKFLKRSIPEEPKFYGISVEQFSDKAFSIRLNVDEFEKHYGENSASKFFDFSYLNEASNIFYLRTYSHSTWDARVSNIAITKFDSLKEAKNALKNYFKKRKIIPKADSYKNSIMHKLW
jgi:hypothetical protein